MTTFKPAKREGVPLLIGLDGASGSGKTFSAQELAAGIADEIGRANNREGRVFGIDTERRRMLHYADRFSFMHAEIAPPFRPQTYGDAIKAAEEQGADVIIIDSFSHEWEGEGGVLEWARTLESGIPKVENPRTYGSGWKDDWRVAPVKSPSNWIEPKQAHKRLVNQMLAARAHVIVCLRSEEKMKLETLKEQGSNGRTYNKTVITAAADLPLLERWVPICEKRFPFEITTSLLLTPNQPGVPIARKLQDQHRPFFPDGQQITRAAGAALARWSMGGAAASDRNAPPTGAAAQDYTLDAARADLETAAQGGTDELRRVWSTKQIAPHRDALQADLDRLKPIAAQNDQQSAGGTDGQI